MAEMIEDQADQMKQDEIVPKWDGIFHPMTEPPSDGRTVLGWYRGGGYYRIWHDAAGWSPKAYNLAGFTCWREVCGVIAAATPPAKFLDWQTTLDDDDDIVTRILAGHVIIPLGELDGWKRR